MSIFDVDDNIGGKFDRDVNSMQAFEQFMLMCVGRGTVQCVVAAPRTNGVKRLSRTKKR